MIHKGPRTVVGPASLISIFIFLAVRELPPLPSGPDFFCWGQLSQQWELGRARGSPQREAGGLGGCWWCARSWIHAGLDSPAGPASKQQARLQSSGVQAYGACACLNEHLC